MSCDVAALTFQVYANYGTWSIDFAFNSLMIKKLYIMTKIYFEQGRKRPLDTPKRMIERRIERERKVEGEI